MGPRREPTTRTDTAAERRRRSQAEARAQAPAPAWDWRLATVLTGWGLAMSLWTDAVADLHGAPARLCGALVVAIVTAHRARSGSGWPVLRSAGLGLVTCAGAALALMLPSIGPWAAACVFALALWLQRRQDVVPGDATRDDGGPGAVLLLTGVHLALTVGLSRCGPGWLAASGVATAVSHCANALRIAHVDFGPSQLLLGAVGTLLLPVVLLGFQGRHRARSAGIALGVTVLGLLVTAAVGSHVILRHPGLLEKVSTGTVRFQAEVLAVWGLAALWTYGWLRTPAGAGQQVGRGRVVLACLLPLGIVLSGWHGETPRVGRVLVYRDNAGDFHVPTVKTWGKRAAGRFGLLCEYVRAIGYPSEFTGPGKLTKDLPGAVGLIMPQPTKRLSAEDIKALRRFVYLGGGMLYLGDHTNVGRCMEPASEVLAPYGVALKFDTVLPSRSGWWADLVARDHPAVRGLRNERCQSGWWVGASLRVSPLATPLLVGTRCYSDWGNARNSKRAYLGNYRIDRGERVGDLVLAAAGASSGRGRVIVFGDTSSPQNLAASQAWEFLSSMLAWLTSRPEWPGWAWVRVVGLVCMVTGCVGLALVVGRPLVLACVVLAALVLCLAPRGFTPVQLLSRSGRETVLVHMPPLSRSSLELMREDGPWGTLLSIARGGKLPHTVVDLRQWDLSRARHLVMLAPGSPLTRRERDMLSRWVTGGGQLVLSCGPEDWASVRRMPILSGAQVTFRSLGAGVAKDTSGQTRYACNAYGLEVDPALWRPILTRLGECFAATSARGRGRVTLIADPAFLHCRNTEGEDMGHIENCRWLTALFSSRPPGRAGKAGMSASGAAKGKTPTRPVR